MNPVATVQKARSDAYQNINDPSLESLEMNDGLARIRKNSD